MTSHLKFLIVDDQKIIRKSLTEKLIDLFSDAEVRETASGKECLSLMQVFSPDIIFMDISMPEMSGIEATRVILSKDPYQKIVGYSMNDNDDTLNKMLNAGAKGYLLKTDDSEDYEEAVKCILSGHLFISRNIRK